MTLPAQKRPRIRLGPGSYQSLRQEVLERDRWRCQNCGRRSNLEVHHIQPRGRQGHDEEENLITLCANCHRASHLSGV